MNNLTVSQWFFVDVHDNIWFMLEMIPVTLAVITFILCGMAVGKKENKTFYGLAVICSVLLMIAQGGWITAHLNDERWFKSLADNIWTIFNTLVMGAFIISTRSK